MVLCLHFIIVEFFLCTLLLQVSFKGTTQAVKERELSFLFPLLVDRLLLFITFNPVYFVINNLIFESHFVIVNSFCSWSSTIVIFEPNITIAIFTLTNLQSTGNKVSEVFCFHILLCLFMFRSCHTILSATYESTPKLYLKSDVNEQVPVTRIFVIITFLTK